MRQAQSESGSSAVRMRTGGESGCRVFWRCTYSFVIRSRGRNMLGGLRTRGRQRLRRLHGGLARKRRSAVLVKPREVDRHGWVGDQDKSV